MHLTPINRLTRTAHRFSLLACITTAGVAAIIPCAQADDAALVPQVLKRVDDFGDLTARFSPDGRWAAVANGNGEGSGQLIVWNEAGDVWFTQDGLPGITTLKWSPDSKMLAVGSPNDVRVLDLEQGSFVGRTLIDDANEQTNDIPSYIEWLSPDRLAIAIARGELIVWDRPASHKILWQRLPADSVRGLGLSPDQKSLAALTGEGVLIYDVTGTPKAPLKIAGLQFPDETTNVLFSSLAWSPDSKLLGAYDERYAYAVWDAASGEVRKSNINDTHNYEHTRYFAIDNSGAITRRVTEGGDHLIHYRGDAQVKKVTYQAENREILDASDNAKQMILCGPEGELDWYSTETGKPVRSLKGMTQWVNAVSWSPNGQYFAAGYGGRSSSASQGEILIYDGRTGEMLRSLNACVEGGEGLTGVNTLVFSPDGRYLVSNAEDKNGFGLRIWETGTWRQLRTIPTEDRMIQLAFSRDGARLAAGFENGDVVEWHSFAHMLAGNAEEFYYLYAAPLKHNSMRTVMVMNLAFSPDGKRLVTACEASPASRTAVWDVESGDLLANLPGQTYSVYGIVFSPDGSTLWTADEHGDVREWEAATMQLKRLLKSEASTCLDMALTPDGKSLIVADYDDLGVISLESGKRIQTLSKGDSFFNCVAVSPKGTLAAAGDETGQIKIWNLATGQPALTILRLRQDQLANGSRALTAAITPDGSYRASNDAEKFLRWRKDGQLLTAKELFDADGVTYWNAQAVSEALQD